MDHFAMLTSHEQLVCKLLYSKGYYFQERFINDLWHSLRTTTNSRWTTGGPPGPQWKSPV